MRTTKLALYGVMALVPSLSTAQEVLEFQPGTYQDPSGSECILNVAEFNAQREQVTISCKEEYGSLTGTWFTGVIEGHPFQLDLTEAKIENIVSADDLAWGKIGSSNVTWWGCMSTGGIISVTQVSESVQINGYGNENKQLCGITLIKNTD